jgi:hypothetical protein
MVLGRPNSDEQVGRDLSRRASAGDESEHLELSPAQATRALIPDAWPGVAASGVDLVAGVHSGSVEFEDGPCSEQLFGPLRSELRG